jgi:hypothetical protein
MHDTELEREERILNMWRGENTECVERREC